MTKVRVAAIGVSVDGFAAGPNQDLEHPLGVGGEAMFEWFLHTRAFKEMHGQTGGSTGVDDDFAWRGFTNVGAWILGRNMFGPVRGPWLDADWRGWWGEEPPYHVETYVLTHHAREPLVMGRTTFHFVTGGIHEALERARLSAKGKDVRIGGGAATIRQYLQAGLVDEMHLAQSPALLGAGEHLFVGLHLPNLGFSCVERVASDKATHLVFSRNPLTAT